MKKRKFFLKIHKLSWKRDVDLDMKSGKYGKFGLLGGGALIGIANGLFGGGGGMLAVPLLRANGLSPVKAHATAIAVILPASLVSGAVYLSYGLTPVSVLLPVALGVAVGGFFGAKLLGVLPERTVTFIFAVLMLIAGARLAF